MVGQSFTKIEMHIPYLIRNTLILHINHVSNFTLIKCYPKGIQNRESKWNFNVTRGKSKFNPSLKYILEIFLYNNDVYIDYLIGYLIRIISSDT